MYSEIPFCVMQITRNVKYAATASSDSSVLLWDVDTGEEITAFKGHQDSVNILAFNPDSTLLATASHDKTVIVWKAAFNPLCTCTCTCACTTLNCGRSHASAQTQVTDGKIVYQLEHSSAPTCLLWSPNGDQIATAHGTVFTLWSSKASGKTLFEVEDAHAALISCLTYHPQGIFISPLYSSLKFFMI